MAAWFRRFDRGLRLVAWLVVAGVGTTMLTQTFGLDPGQVTAAAQSLTPYGVVLLVPVLVAALVRRWWTVGTVGAAIGIGGVVLATPLVFPSSAPSPVQDATTVDIAVVNLLYENDRSDEVGDTLLALDPDVIVFTEYSAEHQERLLAHDLAGALPHRVDREGFGASGTAVWSQHPLTDQPTPDMVNFDVDIEILGPNGPFRVWAVHPPTPFHEGWQRDLRTIARRAPQVDGPLVVAGDFNASYWHPVFRDVLRAGLTDAHIVNDRGWTTSWPLGRRIPPFVRLDHALTNDLLTPVAVHDFTVPGSDHRGLVVSVAPAA
ncbi:MAG: endonuclease/exonuclease/phosphatase family protein [Actinomycetota bacterium]